MIERRVPRLGLEVEAGQVNLMHGDSGLCALGEQCVDGCVSGHMPKLVYVIFACNCVELACHAT